MSQSDSVPEWINGHAHEPNLDIPAGDGRFTLSLEGRDILLTLDALRQMPQTTLGDCYIVSTGHGTSGPFDFTGVLLSDLVRKFVPGDPAAFDVISADGFGTRLLPHEIDSPPNRPPLLAVALGDSPLSRAQGLIRLIVPSETNDALRQVKWVAQLVVHRTLPA